MIKSPNRPRRRDIYDRQVRLWIARDESAKQLARAKYREARRRLVNYHEEEAAEHFIADLKAKGVTKTPDGAPLTERAVAYAIRLLFVHRLELVP